MSLKRFKPALGDCQQAASLQSDSPSPKTLVRLARCQLSTGSTAPALSTLRSVLAIEAKNAAALQLQTKVLELEAHLRNFEGSRDRQDWGMARLALDKCMQVIESEGGDIPIQWRLWRVEVEIAKKNWDAASMAAKCVPLPFLKVSGRRQTSGLMTMTLGLLRATYELAIEERRIPLLDCASTGVYTRDALRLSLRVLNISKWLWFLSRRVLIVAIYTMFTSVLCPLTQRCYEGRPQLPRRHDRARSFAVPHQQDCTSNTARTVCVAVRPWARGSDETAKAHQRC